MALDTLPAGLGVGYRLEARFITGSNPRALVVPRPSVLQAADGSFYVFKVGEGGQLARQVVQIGLRSDTDMEITGGLSAGERVLALPNATMREGERVRPVDE